MTADPLADVLRQADRVTSGGDYYADMARAAREHIAAEIEAANNCYDESLDYAARIARRQT